MQDGVDRATFECCGELCAAGVEASNGAGEASGAQGEASGCSDEAGADDDDSLDHSLEDLLAHVEKSAASIMAAS